MTTILPVSQMSEEDIKLNFITPALQNRGWKDKITMETKVQFTDGRISLEGNIPHREKPKKADYVLYINANNPIAVVEAKDNSHMVSYGLQQAMEYAKQLDVPFAYSSNGDAFMEHDFLTGTERQIPLDQFPTYQELVERYKRGANAGAGINEQETAIIEQPYYSSLDTYPPRYYQRIAVNRTLDAIARGQKRILLAMATGTGKTYTAFQIVYRLLKANMLNKVLYLADRNNLVDQSIQQDFAPLTKTIHKVNFAKDDPNTVTSYEVYFSLYHQLAGEEQAEDENEEGEEEAVAKIASLFRPDFFDLVIVDECHRGSAKKDSNWRKILEYFSGAVQIGMTATPKETKYISNIDYFGEPIYSYSLREGIDDGFLAPFRVINIKTNIGDYWRPVKGQKDINGNEIEDRIYNNSDYDYKIVMQDRIDQVAEEITKYLKQTNNRMAKTIVFCANEEHAEHMRIALTNCNADMVQQNPDYVVRITGSDVYGKKKLKYFISVSAEYPVIATTSKLLSTGADCKMTKLIVLDQMITSMTEFKQIVGRGTRLRENDGKTNFTIMDFRGVTRLFADPEWDGPIEQDPTYDPSQPQPPTADGDTPGTMPEPPLPPRPVKPKYYVDKNGCKVVIESKSVSIYDTAGRLLKQQSIIDYTKTNIIGEYADLSNFISTWTDAQKKEEIQKLLLGRGIDLDIMKKEKNMEDVDDFDFICHVAYNQKPLSRKERAEGVKKQDFFSKYSGVAKEVLEILLEKYKNEGIYPIENTKILNLQPFMKYGTPSKIANYFGGREGYLEAVHSLGKAIYGVFR